MNSGSTIITNCKRDQINTKTVNIGSSSSTSSTYTYEYEYQYVYPKISSLLTHKSLIGARYEREFWTDELIKKLYYYLPNDRYWNKFDLDNIDENIKLRKLRRPIENDLFFPKEFEFLCDDYSDLAATTTGATAKTGLVTSSTTGATTTGVTTTTTTGTENVSSITSNTEHLIERLNNDLDIKKKFLQCIGSYPDKKLRKHFYKLLKWRKDNIKDYDNREYFKQILKNTIKKCKKKIRKKRKERKVDENETKQKKNQILERLDVQKIEEKELEKRSGKYSEKYYQDTRNERLMKSDVNKNKDDIKVKDIFKRNEALKSRFSKASKMKDSDAYTWKSSDRKAKIKDVRLRLRRSKSLVDQKSTSKAKSVISSVTTQRYAEKKSSKNTLEENKSGSTKKRMKLSTSKSGTSRRSGSLRKSKGSGTAADKIEDIRRKMNELNYSSKSLANYKLGKMAQFTVNDENINYLTVTDDDRIPEIEEQPDTHLRETVKKAMTEISMEKNNQLLLGLTEGGAIIKGNFLGIKPELNQITEETIKRQNEAKNKIITILKTLKGIRKNIRQNRLETKKFEANLKINQRMIENLRKNKVLNWFKQKDYLKQMKIKKDEMRLFGKSDHIDLLRRILSENKTIGTFLEHRWDIVTYLADTSKNQSDASSKKASAVEIPYESGTSDDEVKPKVIEEKVEKDKESRKTSIGMSARDSVASRSSRISSLTKKSVRETLVYEISEPDDFRDLDDWEEFMDTIKKETKAMVAEEKKGGIGIVDKGEILYVLRPESKRTSLPDFIYEMFETGLIPDAEEVEEDIKVFKKKKREGEESVFEGSVEESCALEHVESDFVVRKVLDKRLEKLFINFDREKIEYTKDLLDEDIYDRCPVQWQITQRRIQQQKLIKECEERSRSFRTIPSSGSSKDDEPCYITDLKEIIGPILKNAITDALMVRPPEKPVEYLVQMLYHYSYHDEYEENMDALDRELLAVYDDLHVNRNYGPRRFKNKDCTLAESDSSYPTDSETTFDSELLEDRDVYDIIKACVKPKEYDLGFLKANVISSESMPCSPSDISISSILTVTTGMTVGTSIATMSIEEPSDLEIYDADAVPKIMKYPPGYAMDPDNPPPFEMVDGQVVFFHTPKVPIFATPLMNLYEPPPFDMGYDDQLFNEVNNLDEPSEIDLDELIPIEENRICHPSYRYERPCRHPCGPCPPPCGYPRGYAMDPDDPPAFDMGYDDLLFNEVNNMDEPIEIDLDELLDVAEILERQRLRLQEEEFESVRPTISVDDV